MSVSHYLHLISMSLDAGRPEFKRQVKKKRKRREKKNCNGNKTCHAGTRTPYNFFLLLIFFTFRVL